MNRQWSQSWRWLAGITVTTLLVAGCVAPTTVADQALNTTQEETEAMAHPELSPVDLAGEKLRVVATTNLVGDVVAQIGGDRIELATLLTPGVDPHSYQLIPTDRQLLEDADVIFINGLGLEEGILPVLDALDNGVPVVAVSTGIAALEFGGHEGEHVEGEAAHAEDEKGHHHEGADPHTWQSVPNVIVWTENIATALSALDPAQANEYAKAAADYRTELEALNDELHVLVETLSAEQRKLVTDHDSLEYLAHEYGFTIVGTVVPSLNTLAATSAQELAALQTQINAEGVKAIFVGSTVNPALVEQLANDLGIQVVPVYTDSLSDADGPASTYVEFMRHNLETIVAALR
jgi:ABC-type Zn uptake system ZnuABC Zn-binding protein ZnuA